MLMLLKLVALVRLAYAIPQETTTGAPSVTVSTAVASPTVPLSSLGPSQAALLPVQGRCIGKIVCPGLVSP